MHQTMPLDSNLKTTSVQSFIARLPKPVWGAQCLGGEHFSEFECTYYASAQNVSYEEPC